MASLITTKKRRDVWTCRQLTVDNYHHKTNNFWGMAKKTPPKKTVWVWRNNSCGQMWLLCSRVLILHQQNTVCPQTCLSLPAGPQPSSSCVPSFLSSLPPSFPPSFLPSIPSLQLTVSRSTYRPCHSGGGRSIGASHQQEVIQMPSPWRQVRLSKLCVTGPCKGILQLMSESLSQWQHSRCLASVATCGICLIGLRLLAVSLIRSLFLLSPLHRLLLPQRAHHQPRAHSRRVGSSHINPSLYLASHLFSSLSGAAEINSSLISTCPLPSRELTTCALSTTTETTHYFTADWQFR